jgi:hypothetical protein
MSVITGKGYLWSLITLLSSRKLLIQRTLPSFLGVMNEGEHHSLSPCTARMPIFTRWSSSF